MKTVNPFYKTQRWRTASHKALRNQKYLCQESLRFGKRVEAEMVHHIYPLESYPELAYVQWNLIGVTFKKHNTFHNRFSNELTEKGLYWQEKRKKEFENWKNKISPPPSTHEK